MAPAEAALALLMLVAPAGTAGVPTGTSGPTADASRRATVLSALTTEVVDGRLKITLRGNGRIEPRAAAYARGLPPRIVIEIPGVTSEVDAITRVARLGVEQVRVATTKGRTTLTRIVVDLTGRQLFGLWREGRAGNDLAILFGESAEEPVPASGPDSFSALPAVENPPGGDAAPTPPRATHLSSIDATVVDGRLRVVLRGNGRIEPRTVEYARDLPPRVFVDLPGVAPAGKLAPSFGRYGIQRVRVGANSLSPLVTRVVLDLSNHTPFFVERGGRLGDDLVLVFGSDASASPGVAGVDDDPVAEAPSLPDDAVSEGAVGTPASESESGASDASRPPPWMRSARAVGGQPPASAVNAPARRPTDDGGPGFVGIRGFRAALGIGYDRWGTEVSNGFDLRYDSSAASPLVTLQTSLWLVDPQILTIDALADLRFDHQRYTSDVLETRTSDTLENYRVNMVLLSGRGSPLSLYFDRAGSVLNQHQHPTLTGDALTLSQTGRQSTRGFSWDLNMRRLPHVSASGAVAERTNVGSFLSGWDSTSRQERLDLRADKEHRWLRYDVSYSHDRSRFVYPLAALSTNYGVDIVRGTTYVTPRPGLDLTAGARMTAFDVGRTDQLDRQRRFMSAGGNFGIQWRWTPVWRFDAHYNASSNESELALSLVTGAQAPPSDADTPRQIRRRFLYQDFDGRMTYTSRDGSTVASAFARGLALDPLPFGTPTLDTLAVAGGQVDLRRSLSGIDVTVGAEVSAGQSTSSRGDSAPYYEASGRIQASKRLATATFSAAGGIRDTEGSYFYPVTGQSWFGGLDVTYEPSRRFQFRGSANRSFLLRDVVFQRGDDHAESYRVGLRGPRFDVAAEYTDTRSTAKGLLETALLADANPELLLSTRPELFGFLYASQQLRRAVDARLTVWRGVDVFARGRLDRLELPSAGGTGFLNQNVGQVGAVVGVRQLQVEVAWEYLEYWSHLASTVDRRFQLRVRRDLVVR